MGESWKVLGSTDAPLVTVEGFAPTTGSGALSEYQTPFPTGFESASVVKASAGQLYQILLSNPSAIPVYLQLFNRITSPPVSTAPLSSYRVEPSSSISLDFRGGKAFSTGITLGMSTIYHAFSGTASGSFNAYYK